MTMTTDQKALEYELLCRQAALRMATWAYERADNVYYRCWSTQPVDRLLRKVTEAEAALELADRAELRALQALDEWVSTH